MKRIRGLKDRVNEFVSGISRQVGDFVSGLIGGKPETATGHQPIPDDDVSVTEIVHEIIETPVSEQPIEFLPEPVDELDEDFDSEFEFQIARSSEFSISELRRFESTFAAAVNYARDIPLPEENISIIYDPDVKLFRVRVDYPEPGRDDH